MSAETITPIPFSSSLELSKFVNGQLVWGDFSFLEVIEDWDNQEVYFEMTAILCEVDFDGCQHFMSIYSDRYDCTEFHSERFFE